MSGVGFSLNPQNNCYDEAVISANFGLGETVVAGVVTPDTFVVDKIQQNIISRNVSDKKEAYVLVDGGGIREEENAEPTASSLTDDQILEVASLDYKGGGAHGKTSRYRVGIRKRQSSIYSKLDPLQCTCHSFLKWLQLPESKRIFSLTLW